MSRGHFKVTSKIKLSDLNKGDRIEESDFASMTEDGYFVQMEYISSEDSMEKIDAKPGVYTIVKTSMGLSLEKTEFIQNNVLRDFVNTKDILEKINNFFSKLNVYDKHKVFPKRGILLYGPPGTGKTTAIAEAVNSVKNNPEYFTLVWHTDKIEAGDVKDFIKHLNYIGPKKMILVVEDIGGIEIDQARMRSESSLLALLDNQEKAFTLPTLILATTNYIENFMGNLTNRPGRFDEKIKVDFPPADARVKLMKFYDHETILNEEAIKKIASKKCDKFTPAQLQEVIVRSEINGLDPNLVIDQIIKEIENYEKNFNEKSRTAIGVYDYKFE
jgi:AAA+ superfamily predicted ATPase